MGYDSYEQINTVVYDAFEVWDAAADALVPDKTESYFETPPNKVQLINPSGTEVSGSIPVTITHLGEGTYLTSFTPNALGQWQLYITDDTYFPWAKRRTYLVETYLRCASDDADYVETFPVIDGDSELVSGLVKADFGIKLYKQDGSEVSATVPVSISEESAEPGNYRASYTMNAEGKWFLVITHSTYAPYGLRGDTRYHVTARTNPSAPTIDTATDDETGTSVTLDLTANSSGNILHVRYRILNTGAWQWFGTTRTGSGELQITGLTTSPYEFQAVEQSDLTGEYSLPSNTKTATVTDGTGGTSPTGALSRPLDLARTMLATSATFQEIVEAGNPTAALAFIFIHNVDADFAGADHAVVSHVLATKDSIGAGSSFAFGDKGDVQIMLQLEIPSTLRQADEEEEAGNWFSNKVGAIVREMALLSGDPDYLDVHTFDVGELERTHQEDEAQGNYNYRAPIVLGWGF